MNEDRQLGYDLATGATHALINLLCVIAVVLWIIASVNQSLGVDLDDSDQDTWHRSGFRVLRDAKTGIEYLSDGHGGLIKRG